MLYRTTVSTYNPQNRLTSIAEWDGGELPTQEQMDQKKIFYTYDAEGKLTDVNYAFAKDGITGLKYAYDKDDYLTTITAKGGLLGKTLREYTYDDFGRVAEMKDYYGFVEGGSDYILREYTYDAFGRVTKMIYTDSKDGEVKESYGYIYDKNSNILQERIISHYAAADGKELDCTKNYTYDKNGRLTKAEVIDHTEGAAGSKMTAYTYDRNGNQTKETDSVSGETLSMTYDAANRLTGYEKKKDGTAILKQKNRYNGEGQRIRKEETKGAESRVRNYYYQDGNVLYTTDEENQRDSFNLLGRENNVITTARGTGSGASWYLYNKDVRGSTSSLIDDSGTAATAYEYDAFGNTTIRVGADFYNELCYTGQVYDQSTGLYYYNARFYDPEDGRFLTQDTYRGEQMEPGTWHLYAYCANNPVNYVDPSGYDAIFLQATKGAKGLGHSALLIKKSGKWKYYSWEGDGYKSWTAQLKNVYKGISSNGVVTKDINSSKSIKRVKNKNGKWTHGRPYNKYFYIRGNFSNSYKYAKEQMNGKHYKKYKLTSVNCVWVTIQLLRMGKISKTRKKKLYTLQWGKTARGKQKYKRTLVPNDIYIPIANIFNVTAKEIT